MNILRGVAITAYRSPSKVLHVVLECDEKGTIISIDVANSLLDFLSPFRRAIRPGALPLAGSPWVSQLKKSDFLTSVLDFMN